MRYIDIDELVLPDGWLDKAATASNAVAAGADPDEYSKVWRELKDALAELFPDKKCWYCESPVDRADNAVDHFRPKGRVSDASSPHSGYRWLSFEHRNYRYACTFCNSLRKDIATGDTGGKADRFPLIVEADRLYAPGPLAQEKPILLDPCELNDWELIGCKQENGKPCPTSNEQLAKHRAEESISIYHLDYEPTCKQRHAVAVRLMADIDQAKQLFGLPGMDVHFTAVAKKIRRAINRKAPFSGDMIFLLKGQRHADHPWIQKLLEI
ncbi:hypothetical protein [Pectobacterium carotovorum]|uniref:hypothetical protein n=1 Tax=Pectobacterium carotovorum TaxID=554 RepID=UPI000501EB4E|nr:hypothetical protein [Pectobacterium carotovorum]KFX02027.1 hypothetical protein JV33_02540 [Pectobacterium carotovorum subsp. carotovorum]KML71894.1 hypothetical protein G032_02100 [Pectobacterium carotovorum subsp. carotovorum ICMP 5702]SHG33987.1 hypothetical protein SAMN05444147_102177 [Pectobacterium carotovorum]